MVNDVLHEDVTVETVDELIAKLPADAHDYHDPSVNWDDDGHGGHGAGATKPPPRSAGVDRDGHTPGTNIGATRSYPDGDAL
jgi:hypothetical protein